MESVKSIAWKAALDQLALDYGVSPQALSREDHTLVAPQKLPGRRQYTEEPPLFQMVTIGRGAVIAAHPALHGELEKWAGDVPGHRLWEYPKLRQLEQLLLPWGWKPTGSFHMFLPGGEFVPALPQEFAYRWYDRHTMKELYPNRKFPNAISEEEKPKRPDVIALAALEGDRIVALAGASADGEQLWQVGIDVLPEYRSRGLGKGLVSELCARIWELGKVPFYGTAPANLHSQNIAVGCGFFPAWAEVSSRPAEE